MTLPVASVFMAICQQNVNKMSPSWEICPYFMRFLWIIIINFALFKQKAVHK